jgi:Vitamin K-dependent gamma-carboxylase
MARETTLRAWLSEPAYGLAALRIAVVGILLVTPELRQAPELARAPELLVASPEGLGWLAGVHFAPDLVSAARVVAFSAGATALLGYWTRLSCALLALTASFLISFSERVGAPLHGMHLLWLVLLLAASPAGDAWSLDAWGEPPPAPSPVYGVPLCFARALLGVVYLFPGVHKLASAGFAWGSASNLTAIMHDKWFQYGRLPLIRFDQQPQLVGVAGALVLSFELSFIVLALLRRTRLLALALGLAFHAATQLGLFIAFPSLWVCYVVLLPWPRSFRKRWVVWRDLPSAQLWPWPCIAVGSSLLLGSAQAGVRGQTRGYPFACYPTFAGVFPRVAPDLVVGLVGGDGQVSWLQRDFARPRSQQEWGRVYWLLGAYGSVASDEQLRHWARERASSAGQSAAFEHATTLRFLLASYATEPSQWGKPPVAARLLRELPQAALH